MDRFFVQELLLSSTDSSSDDDQEIRELRPKVDEFINTFVDNYNEEEFRQNFRIQRNTFNQVLTLIKDRISTQVMAIGHHTISAKAQLLIALWYLATPDSYRSICGRFNIGQATGLRTVRRVVNALFRIGPTIIRWPVAEQIDQIVEEFHLKGFPNTIGVLDGTHIPIPQPKLHPLSYINRHNFPSIILQAVCGPNLEFIDCYAGEVGSRHDASVLKRSSLSHKITERPQEFFPNNTHIIGDKAYPCLPQLLVPYKDNGHLTNAQINYNYHLSKARSTIERAFALLKKRFRCLKFLDVVTVEWIPKYIIACCVLHNICLENGDLLDVQEEEINEDVVHVVAENLNRQHLELGWMKRDMICAELINNVN